MRLDLDEHRDLGELIGLTFTLFGRHLAVFLSLTLLVVAPIALVVDGVWAGYLSDGGNASPPLGAAVTSFALSIVVIPPLVTALQVTVVQGLARGEEPTVGRALSGAASRLLPAIVAVCLYTVALILGLVALIVPGIWIGPSITGIAYDDTAGTAACARDSTS